MLSNAYFLAKFRFDTAENEPAKNLQNFAKFAKFANPNPPTQALRALGNECSRYDGRGLGGPRDERPWAPIAARPGKRGLGLQRPIGKISAKFS